MIEKFSPKTVLLPVPNYVAATKVSADARFVVTSGTVGVRLDGTYPGDLEGQTRVALENLEKILKDAGLTIENIIKLNFFVKAGQDVSALRRARDAFMPKNPIASTVLFVSGLVVDYLYVEIDCWAAS